MSGPDASTSILMNPTHLVGFRCRGCCRSRLGGLRRSRRHGILGVLGRLLGLLCVACKALLLRGRLGLGRLLIGALRRIAAAVGSLGGCGVEVVGQRLAARSRLVA